MKASFDEAKDIVLVATYEALYGYSDWETFAADLIQKRVGETFSLGFTRRILSSLVAANLVKFAQYDESSQPEYTLTDEGLAKAEALPPLYVLSGRFSQGTNDDIGIPVPASDRLVTLSHNQVTEFDAPVTEIVEALEQDNGSPDQPGLRERLIGQVKAGRELIRAGQFKAYLLYETLVRALGELITRYANPTISALANALLGAIAGQLLQS